MKSLGFSRYALCLSIAAVMLGGCGSQPPIGAPGAMPQTSFDLVRTVARGFV